MHLLHPAPSMTRASAPFHTRSQNPGSCFKARGSGTPRSRVRSRLSSVPGSGGAADAPEALCPRRVRSTDHREEAAGAVPAESAQRGSSYRAQPLTSRGAWPGARGQPRLRCDFPGRRRGDENRPTEEKEQRHNQQKQVVVFTAYVPPAGPGHPSELAADPLSKRLKLTCLRL